MQPKNAEEKLKERYGEKIVITKHPKVPTTVCFTDVSNKILKDRLLSNVENENNPENGSSDEEKLNIVLQAANIIREDVKSHVYSTENYEAPENLDKAEDAVPKSLMTFLDALLNNNKRSSTSKENTFKKIVAFAHCLISAIRPRSFISSILLGLGVFVHRRLGSKTLIEILSSLGLSVSYDEVRLYEASAVLADAPEIKENSFVQFVFDNADYDVITRDGHNTFHAMGGIQCITPAGSFVPVQTIPRLKKVPTSSELSTKWIIPVKNFENKGLGLKNVKIKDLEDLRRTGLESSKYNIPLYSWFVAKSLGAGHLPSWSGCMEVLTKSNKFETSAIRFLPFLNLNPSNYDTIFSVLSFASEECKKLKQKAVIVTFDQPLFWKAREIVSACGYEGISELSSIIIRLGGFHLLMSFLGAIGYIMDGSGLKELWYTILASKSAEKALSGHNFSRALRAHLLTYLALSLIILNHVVLSDEEEQSIRQLFGDLVNDPPSLDDLYDSEVLQKLREKIEKVKNEIKMKGKTASLWILYHDIMTLVFNFIEAERTGNFELHLITAEKMIPIFHAAGHFLYAKSVHLYLQDMRSLFSKMSEEELKMFTEHFAPRRSRKFWSGLWTDFLIETTLMRTMKCTGGLTRGRGISDSVLARWIIGLPVTSKLCEYFEQFTGKRFSSSEQHLDWRPATMERNEKDFQKLLEWFQSHNPFPDSQDIVSIFSGVVGDEKINCHQSEEIGTQLMTSLIGQTFGDVKLQRKARVLPLSAVNLRIKVNEKEIPIDTTLLFQRFVHATRNDEDIASYFSYELSPVPLSIFDEHGMRKNQKSSLYEIFEETSELFSAQKFRFILDGGFLLHRVVWPTNSAKTLTFNDLLELYVSYVIGHYGTDSIIVFDGYCNSSLNIKNHERLLRYGSKVSPEIRVDGNQIFSEKQELFLANSKNKEGLINLLTDKFKAKGIQVLQADDDADSTIVNTAIKESTAEKPTCIVGEDVDLLIILIGLAPKNKNVFFFKPGSKKIKSKFFSSKDLQISHSVIQILLPTIHAISGCDSTSGFFGRGKLKFIKLISGSETLRNLLKCYVRKEAKKEELIRAGEDLVLKLYGAPVKIKSVNELRFHNFKKSTVTRKSAVKLESLPPTKAALDQHVFRTYLQVQRWMGNDLPPTEWGWELRNNMLMPVKTTIPPAPETLLKLITCSCKTCGKACGCRKAGLKCSSVCKSCIETNCENLEICQLGGSSESSESETDDGE